MTGDDADGSLPDSHELPPDAEEPPAAPRAEDDLEEFLTPTRRFVQRALPVVGVLVALAMVLALGRGLVDAWLFDRAGDRVEEELEDEADRALARSVLLVRTIGCDGGSGSGTAFVTEVDGASVLVTNRHVVQGASTVGLRSLTGESVPLVTSWRLSEVADVATLSTSDQPLPPPLPLATEAPREGTPVRTVGFPSALPFTTSGTVVAVERGRLTAEVRTEPGASGSPLLAERGQVVGQIFARSGDGLGVATTAPALRDALDRLGPTTDGC